MFSRVLASTVDLLQELLSTGIIEKHLHVLLTTVDHVLKSFGKLLQESNTHVKLPVYAMRHLNRMLLRDETFRQHTANLRQ